MSKNLVILEKALEHYGIHELVDGKPNPTVLGFINDVSGKHIEINIPWCAAFVGSILKSCNVKHKGDLSARSYLKVGTKTTKPKLGDIVVFWRQNPNSWKGHVGFYIGENDHVIHVLSGNQQDSVCVHGYPKKRLLEYRTVTKTARMAVVKKPKSKAA